MMARIVPHPRLALLLTLLWLLLNQSLSIGHLVLGAVIGIGIGWAIRATLPDLPRVRAPGRLLCYLVLVLRDIVVANIHVARLVLSPLGRLRPRIVVVPLDVDHPAVASLLAATVTLTPGTVSVDLDPGRRELTVHALDAPDDATVIDEIKSRYERRLREIFGC
jgi:multicomponent K+:H+ antiporter subunit E